MSGAFCVFGRRERSINEHSIGGHSHGRQLENEGQKETSIVDAAGDHGVSLSFYEEDRRG